MKCVAVTNVNPTFCNIPMHLICRTPYFFVFNSHLNRYLELFKFPLNSQRFWAISPEILFIYCLQMGNLLHIGCVASAYCFNATNICNIVLHKCAHKNHSREKNSIWRCKAWTWTICLKKHTSLDRNEEVLYIHWYGIDCGNRRSWEFLLFCFITRFGQALKSRHLFHSVIFS